jgi:hypothetical protein
MFGFQIVTGPHVVASKKSPGYVVDFKVVDTVVNSDSKEGVKIFPLTSRSFLNFA